MLVHPSLRPLLAHGTVYSRSSIQPTAQFPGQSTRGPRWRRPPLPQPLEGFQPWASHPQHPALGCASLRTRCQETRVCFHSALARLDRLCQQPDPLKCPTHHPRRWNRGPTCRPRQDLNKRLQVNHTQPQEPPVRNASHAAPQLSWLQTSSTYSPKMLTPGSVSQFLSRAHAQDRDTEQNLQNPTESHSTCTFNTWINQTHGLRLHVWAERARACLRFDSTEPCLVLTHHRRGRRR